VIALWRTEPSIGNAYRANARWRAETARSRAGKAQRGFTNTDRGADRGEVGRQGEEQVRGEHPARWLQRESLCEVDRGVLRARCAGRDEP
jgi:hypothetical protein